MKKFVNGQYVELTAEEVAELQAEKAKSKQNKIICIERRDTF